MFTLSAHTFLSHSRKFHSLEDNTKIFSSWGTLGGIKMKKAEKIRYQPANFNKLTKMIDTVTPVCLVKTQI
jgi:hypothetical protein